MRCIDIMDKKTCESYRQVRQDGTSFAKCEWAKKGTGIRGGRAVLLEDSCIGTTAGRIS